MHVNIREATLEDTRKIAYVRVKSWQSAYQGMIDADYLATLDIDKDEKRLRKLVTRNSLVCEVDEQLIGFLSYSKARDEDLDDTYGEIVAIYLLSDFQHYGLGKQLMLAGIEKLKALGFTKIVLWVLDQNKAAIEFYQRIGFKFDGHTKTDMIGSIVTELRMREDFMR